jgi:hypothetical protein
MQQRALGATWKLLSSFHAQLLRKVDEESEKFVLNESVISRASPQLSWIDTPSRYLQQLQQNVAQEAAKKAAVDAVKESQTKLDAAVKKATAAASAGGSKATKSSKKENNDAELRLKLDATKKKAKASGEDSVAGADADNKESAAQRRKRVRAEMLDMYGVDDEGREPCYFHHREGTERCRFEASVCKTGHHLGKKKVSWAKDV